MCDSNGGASGWDLSLKVGLHCGVSRLHCGSREWGARRSEDARLCSVYIGDGSKRRIDARHSLSSNPKQEAAYRMLLSRLIR